MDRCRAAEIARADEQNMRNGIKVLQIGKFYPPDRGGMESHLQTLCDEIHKIVDIEVIVANSSRKSIRDTVNGVVVRRMANIVQLFAAPLCPEMVRAIRETPADIVHIHVPNPLGIIAYLLSGHKGKLVVTYHSDVIRQSLLAQAFQPILDYTLARSSSVIVTSPNYAASSKTLRGFTDRCRVIPMGIHIDELQRFRTDQVQSIRAKYGPRIVLAVGRLVYYKGFEYLIKAMSGVDGHLLLIGNGPMRQQFEKLIDEHGVGNRVSLLGGVQDVVPYYQACDIFVLPSVARSEAFGLVQLEAMACGKPVVNTQLDSGVPFVSPHGVTGLTVAPCDSNGLTEAINTLFADDSLRQQFGKASRSRVEEEFSVGVMRDRTLQLYASVMAGSQ